LRNRFNAVLRRKFLAQSSAGLQVEFAEVSDRGRVREHNEDYFGHVAPKTAAEARSHGWLFVLADGVGGQEQGEVASRTAVESVLAGFRAAAAGESHSTLLARLIQTANTHVFEAGHRSKSNGAGMATTMVACAFRFDRAVVAHVGDSRCYLLRHGQARALTSDHTMAADQIRAGILSRREAAKAATQHVLSRSLGGDLFVSVDVSEHLILSGDVFLLCSDGLHGAVPEAEIAAVVSRFQGVAEAAQTLVSVANERDGSDNVTAQIIRVRSVERVGMYRGRPYRLH
jgi:protein phosphatase